MTIAGLGGLTTSGVVRATAYVAILGLAAAVGATAWRATAAVKGGECRLALGDPTRVTGSASSAALTLADGRRVQLAGIEAPVGAGADRLTALVRNMDIRWANADSAKQGEPLRSQVFLASGEWVQGTLVSEGLARVRTWPDHRECARALLAREGAARAAKRGLWSDAAYAVRAPETIPQGAVAFQLVEGRVANVADVRGRIFLNFGEDYRTDFTIHVPPDKVANFSAAGLNLSGLRGKRVRVRGTVSERNGPAITASIPEQIEVLD